MKKERIARLHGGVHKLETFLQQLHAFRIGPGLRTDLHMLDTTTHVRSPQELHTAVLTRTGIDRDGTAKHIRIQTVIALVPIAVVLVPLPRAPHTRLLQHHLVVEVIDFVTQQKLGIVDNALTGHKCT